jgi:glycosyltransferase involved in cell wall biosynthesis
MKIVIATGIFPPEIGGPATYAAILARELPKHSIKADVLPFSTVRHLPRIARHVAYTYALLKRGRGADIIFVQDTVSTGLPALVASRLLRTPLLLRVPGDYAWEQASQRFKVFDSVDDFQRKRYGLGVWVLRSIQKLVSRNADRVIVPSEYFKHIVIGWGVRPHRIDVIYNSVEKVEPVLPAHMPPRPFMVSAGRLVKWKGFGTLVELLPRIPEWRLVIIGDGPLRESLASQARERGVAERIIFTGAISRDEVMGWYYSADAFVLNSSFESFSYQVAEALQAGVPIIATNIGSLPELVESGREGMLIAPNDLKGLEGALKSITEEPDLWRERTDAAERKAEQFSVAAMIERFQNICNQLI